MRSEWFHSCGSDWLVRLRPVVDRTLPLERAREAQEALSRREQFGKIVLTVGEADIADRPPAADG